MKRPYDDYQSSPFWRIIEKELDELKENRDLTITTDPYYVIGSLTKVVVEYLDKQNRAI